MKVILHKDVAKMGKDGDVVTVADGYARNYLFPRNLAVLATEGALKNIALRAALDERRSEKLRSNADQQASALEGKSVTITAKTGSADRLYGSITAADVASAIASTLSVTVDKRNVQLNDPIKALGTFSVPVKLHRDVTVPVTVEVVKASA